MSKSWEGGSTRRWRKIRLYVLNRDKWICQLCDDDEPMNPALRPPHPMSATVHHTHGKINGDDPRYLEAAHRKCNMDIGDPNAQPDPQPRPMTRW